MWDNCVEDLLNKCRHDYDMSLMVRGLNLIEPDVKIAVLQEYLNKCELKNCIAFYQWRCKYPSKHTADLEEHKSTLNEILQSLSKKIKT